MENQILTEPGHGTVLPRRQDAGERVSVPVQGEHIPRRQGTGAIVRPEVRTALEQAFARLGGEETAAPAPGEAGQTAPFPKA